MLPPTKTKGQAPMFHLVIGDHGLEHATGEQLAGSSAKTAL